MVAAAALASVAEPVLEEAVSPAVTAAQLVSGWGCYSGDKFDLNELGFLFFHSSWTKVNYGPS